MNRLYVLFVIAILSGLVSCGPRKTANPNTPLKKAIDVSMLDSTFNPADDFFEFVNERWIKANPIPASKSSWGAFSELDERSNEILKQIQEKAASERSAASGSNSQLLGAFYRSAMDSVAIDNAGLEPLKPLLDELDTISTSAGWAKFYARNIRWGLSAPLYIYVNQDDKDATRYITNLWQSGLGLPDRDYYFRKDEQSAKNRAEYLKYVERIFELAGDNSENAAKRAANVMEIETSLAGASMQLVELRDPQKTYNIMTAAELKKLAPNLNWDVFLAELGIPAGQDLIVCQPKFVGNWSILMKKTGKEKWRDYNRFHLINSAANTLSSDFEIANFEFYDKTLSGKEAMEPRYKRVTRLSSWLLRDLLGQEYVKIAFDEKAKKKALELVNNIRAALSERIDLLTWMSDSTKIRAKEKLNKIMVKIGYPDKWWAYDGLEIKDQHFMLNVCAASDYEFKRMINKLGKPVDRAEWGMGVHMVNAYYNPSLNEIVFPAAILQPPFFDADADDAINYGGIGMVIGHEITHGFDDSGCQYDADGNLRNWWEASDAEKYEALTARFINQYNDYIPLRDIHINGEMTLGENIADMGGMIITYTAFKNVMKSKSNEPIDGLTPDQRFFISYAQIWRSHLREQALEQRLYTDFHSPAKYRVIGVLSNMTEFYAAFNVTEDNKMYRPDSLRCTMW